MPSQFEIQTPSTNPEVQGEPRREAYSRPTVETLDLGATHQKLTPVPESVIFATGS